MKQEIHIIKDNKEILKSEEVIIIGVEEDIEEAEIIKEVEIIKIKVTKKMK